MRLFIAIELSEDVKNYLIILQKKIGRDLAKINYIAKKNIHITLKFLGEIEENKINEFKKKLNSINFKKIELRISKIGLFPNDEDSTILWVGFEDETRIIELQKKIDEETIELSKQNIKFGGHITLGRIKNVKNKEKFIKRVKESEIDKLNFNVNDFKLIRSVLSKEGPNYEVLDTYFLE